MIILQAGVTINKRKGMERNRWKLDWCCVCGAEAEGEVGGGAEMKEKRKKKAEKEDNAPD